MPASAHINIRSIRERRHGQDREFTRGSPNWEAVESSSHGDGGWWPDDCLRDGSGDYTRAGSAEIMGLERDVSGRAVDAQSVGDTGVGWHPSFFETELVGPGGGFDLAALERLTDSPGPEEVVLEVICE